MKTTNGRTVGYIFGVREVAELRRIALMTRGGNELRQRLDAVLSKAEPVREVKPTRSAR
jgi:hypothetical protein